MIPSHYDTLGVSPSSSKEDIQRAYRACLLAIHPDKHDTVDKTCFHDLAEKIERIKGAYEVLKDPNSKAEYDHWLRWENVFDEHIEVYDRISWSEMDKEDGDVGTYVCRCGDVFRVPLSDIDQVSNEYLLQCESCSLVIAIVNNVH